MELEIKEKWVQALESGEYNQGRGQLIDEYGNLCCLAVLGKCQGLKFKGSDEFDGEYIPGTYSSYSQLVQFGLDGVNQDKLITMNDNEQKSFKEIAEYIKENL
jgi:hypothetical protein